MNHLKNTKAHLDDFFAEARANGNITPAENLLKREIAAPQNSFKSGFVKVGFAGMVGVAALSFFLLKEDDGSFKKPINAVKVKNEIVRSEDFKNKNSDLVVKSEIQTDEKKNSLKNSKLKIIVVPPVEGDIPENAEIIVNENLQLSAIPLVELRDGELKKLGIEVLKDKSFIFIWSDNIIHVTTKITGSSDAPMPTIRTVPWDEHLKNPPPSFVPVRITDITGQKEFFTAVDDIASAIEIREMPDEIKKYIQSATMDSVGEAKFEIWRERVKIIRDSINELSRLLPIKAGNFIMWYKPSDEVLKALPESVCNTIHAELTGNNGTWTQEYSQDYPTSGYCYLDLCEKTNGAIMCSKVFPNPAANKQTFVSFELSEERAIAIALYDLSGRKLREFSALKTFEKGKHEEELSLVGIEKGIYLIAIITDRGEKLSRRIIID